MEATVMLQDTVEMELKAARYFADVERNRLAEMAWIIAIQQVHRLQVPTSSADTMFGED